MSIPFVRRVNRIYNRIQRRTNNRTISRNLCELITWRGSKQQLNAIHPLKLEVCWSRLTVSIVLFYVAFATLVSTQLRMLYGALLALQWKLACHMRQMQRLPGTS
jgi:hypothetical protein